MFNDHDFSVLTILMHSYPTNFLGVNHIDLRSNLNDEITSIFREMDFEESRFRYCLNFDRLFFLLFMIMESHDSYGVATTHDLNRREHCRILFDKVVKSNSVSDDVLRITFPSMM